ncbi:MAG: acyl-CoA dehydrogenase family protein [Acidimicrobiia bacterium]
MDFSLSETQTDLIGLAKQIFEKELTLEGRKAAEQHGSFLTTTWSSVSEAGLAGMTFPEARGGLGLSFLDAAIVLVEMGRAVAQIPLLQSAIAGVALEICDANDAHSALANDIASGHEILAIAAVEFGATDAKPLARATRSGDGWVVDGTWTGVSYACQASTVLAAAQTDDGVLVFLADTNDPAITLTDELALNWEPQARVDAASLAVASGSVLSSGAAGEAAWDRIRQHLIVGMCAIGSGVAHEAVRQTAEYATNRMQFNRPIGSFQAVAQRLADAFVDARGIELTMLQAATHLAQGQNVPNEVATAKFWVAESGSRVGHAALHVHGGVSIDIDFPIHRYFLWAKQMEFGLGGATSQLVTIGRSLAATAPGLSEWHG